MGLSGMPFVGVDIGGFAEAPTAELYTRWLQLGVFYPFMRTHTTFGTPDQDPWSYGAEHEALNRRAIELRYELLPHIYNVMHEASVTGLPALRPLLLEFPDDPSTYARDVRHARLPSALDGRPRHRDHRRAGRTVSSGEPRRVAARPPRIAVPGGDRQHRGSARADRGARGAAGCGVGGGRYRDRERAD